MPSDAQGEYREMRVGSEADHGLNWEPWIIADNIATSAWDVPAGIEQIEPDPDFTPKTTIIWLRALEPVGQTYILENTITTVGGRKWHRPLRIKVVALVPEVADVVGFTYNELHALRRAYAQGVLRVRYGTGDGQKEVEYPNGDELLKRIRHLEAILVPEPSTSGRRRQVRFSTGKGY